MKPLAGDGHGVKQDAKETDRRFCMPRTEGEHRPAGRAISPKVSHPLERRSDFIPGGIGDLGRVLLRD